MRGLARLVACLCSLTRATPLVLPTEDVVERLLESAIDEATWDQAAPALNDLAGPEISSVTLEHFNTLSDLESHNADHDSDSIQAWLDSLGSSETTSGAIHSASLFPSMTLSSVIGQVTHPSQLSGVSDVDEPPSPTPFDEPASPASWPSAAGHHGRPDRPYQQPLGGFGETWRLAKLKAQSVVAVIASHLTECPSSPKTALTVASGITSTIATRAAEATVTPLPGDDLPAEQLDHPPWPSSKPAYHVDDQPLQSTQVVAGFAAASSTQILPGHVTASTVVATAAAISHSVATATPAVAQPSSDSQHPTDVDESTADAMTKASSRLVPRYVLTIVIPVLLTIILSAVIFIIIRHRNPRRRAECRARCEERHNRRLYRLALRKHQIETWTQRVKSSRPLSWFIRRTEQDLAEKGLLDSEAKPIQPNSVSTEIRSFREAHELVGSLVDARGERWSSRDRRRTYMWLFAGRVRRQRALSSASSDLSDSEKSAPPLYEDRVYDEKIEAAIYMGNQHEDAPDSDKSSVSSIIPTSPRQSTFTFSAGDPDSDKE